MRIRLGRKGARGLGAIAVGAIAVFLLVVRPAAGGWRAGAIAGAARAAQGNRASGPRPTVAASPRGILTDVATTTSSQREEWGSPSLAAPVPPDSSAGLLASGAGMPTPHPWPTGGPGVMPQPKADAAPSVLTSALARPPAPGRSDVADLLQKPVVPGKSLQIDAYFVSAPGAPSLPAPPGGMICPSGLFGTLVDRPFQPALAYLNIGESVSLPDSAPWLIAASPEQPQPGMVPVPNLPYHARLQGHRGDPAFARCPNAGRIFVVEQVVQVYEQAAPGPTTAGASVPAGYSAWPSYADAAGGYTVRYPPGWQVERADTATVAFRGQQWPDNPVLVRVYDIELSEAADPASAYVLLPRDASLSPIHQGEAPYDRVATQGLSGYLGDASDGAETTGQAWVLFPVRGRTYELSLAYPVGLDASQPLMDIYSAIVEGFQVGPGLLPSPTRTATPGPSPIPFASWR